MDVLDRLPLDEETFEAILARLTADVNAGVAPTDANFADVVPGSPLHDLYGSCSLEFDRLYDRIHSELPAAALPTTAQGEWLDAWADVIGLERKDEAAATGTVRFTGSDSLAGPLPIPPGTQVSTIAASEEQEEVVFQTTEAAEIAGAGLTVDVPVIAIEAGAAGNVAANSVTLLSSAIAGVASVTNIDPITAGADVESDEELQERIGRRLGSPQGPGNTFDYVDWATSYPGIRYATVQPNWDGITTVRVLVTDVNNDPVSQAVIDGLQALLDPAPGEFGQAPIGAEVTVATPDVEDVTVAATIVFEAGYTLNGTAGSRPLNATISEAIAAYVNRLPVGGDVILWKVGAAIVDVEGVANVAGVTINGAAADLAVDADHVASLVAANLAE
jgi:uncharacterized phage protein gp47/JayE